jgi:hypothetical protein
VWIILGKYTLLQLFLAVLMEVFEVKYETSVNLATQVSPSEPEQRSTSHEVEDSGRPPSRSDVMCKPEHVQRRFAVQRPNWPQEVGQPHESEVQDHGAPSPRTAIIQCGSSCGSLATVRRMPDSNFEGTDLEGSGRSMWIFPEALPARVWLHAVVTSKSFDRIMLAMIVLNCVAMALENPDIEPGSLQDIILEWSDASFTIIFCAEALAKIVAFTFARYIRDIANQVIMQYIYYLYYAPKT